jgi:hypothetical protein
MDEDLTGERFLQVFFRPGNEFSESELDHVRTGAWPVRSQGIWWGGRPEDVTLRTPEYFDVTLIQHYPREGDLGRRTGIAELELTWDIGSPALLTHMFNTMAVNNVLDIYYEFQWSLNPYDVYPDRFMIIRTRLTPDPSTTPGGIFVEYFLMEEMPDGTLREINPLNGIRLLEAAPRLINSPLFGFMAQIRIEIDTYHLMRHPMGGFDLGPPIGLNFPSIYFMNVRPIRVMNNTDFQTPSSQYSSFTLSEFEDPEVPPPQNLRVVPDSERPNLPEFVPNAVTIAAFDVTWDVPLARMQDYLMRSYGLLRRGGRRFGDFELEMTLYISQNEQLMVQVLGYDTNFPEDPEVQRAERHDARLEEAIMVVDGGGAMGGVLDFAGAERDRLRDGGIVAVRNLRIPASEWARVYGNEDLTTPPAILVWEGDTMYGVEFSLEGLDKNQHYYVYVDFVVTQRPTFPIYIGFGTPGVQSVHPFSIMETSLISNMVGVTIPTDPVPPDGIDVDPPAPDLRVDAESIGLNTATIYWDRIEPIPVPPGYTESLEYQVIRIRDNQMHDDEAERTRLLNSRIPIAQVWAALAHHEHITSFETIPGVAGGEPANAMALRGLQGRPDAPNMDLISIEHTDPPGMDPLRVRDDSLASNNLYFYYARTVRVVRNAAGVEVARRYSVWSNVSVTTTIAGAPRNLRIEHGPDRDFDRSSQIMFSFEAPIGAHPNSLAFLGTEFMFEYSIRKDQEDWQTPVEMGNAYLRTHSRAVPPDPEDDVEWTWFLYFITDGLEHGTYYSIRVRLIELCPTTGARLSYSIWSNIATWMTEICDCCWRADDRERNWLDYLRRRLEELLRRPYWTIRQDMGGHQVIFRPDMYNNLLQTSVGGQIHLPFENARQSTFYIPMENFRQTWYAEQGFLLVNDDGNMQISIPARGIDIRENDVVIDVAAYIRRNNDFNDSVIRLNVDWSHPLLVQNEEPITPVADVRMDIIAIRPEIARWSNNLLSQMEELIEDIMTDPRILEALSEAIREVEAPSEDISRYMVRVVQDAERQMHRLVQENMTTLTRNSRAANVPRLDRSMSVSTRFDVDSGALEGYQSLAGNLWTNMPTMQVGDGQGFFTNQLASFVFTGRIIHIPYLDTVVGGPQARGVIGRHGLDDFFGRGNIDINAHATRSMLVDSLARMSGAPRGSNSVQWLRAEGVDVSAAGMQNPITNQSALNLLMLVYENRTGTRIDSLQIRNMNVINNMQGLDPHYRAAVAAAVELNLVDGTTLQPNSILSIGELLEMLAVMDSLLGL